MAAGLWLGALVMAGATAGILFTTMRTLGPSFDLFAAYSGDQSNLGAGFLQNRVFLALDAIQFGAATLILATTIAGIAFFRLPLRRVSSAIRLVALGIAMVLLSFHLFVLTPRMQSNALDYWAAAERGDAAQAETSYAAFDADHPTARRVLMGTMLSVLVLLTSGVWGAMSAGATGETHRAEVKGKPAAHREEPALNKRGGAK